MKSSVEETETAGNPRGGRLEEARFNRQEPSAAANDRAFEPAKMTHPYRVIRKLGSGGMGEVFLAEDTRLGRKVALKFLTASYRESPERRVRFLEEARAASVVRSPHIATIYDIGEYEDAPFIVMEYVEGETLAAKIERGPLPLHEAVDIAIQIVEGLAAAHAHSVIHRDIKTTNLIITPDGRVKVLDFGIAKVLARRGPDERTITLDDQSTTEPVTGTMGYMSPEQLRRMPVDARADLFAVGVVLYEMITGQLPFRGETTGDLIAAILGGGPPRLAAYVQNVPEELEQVVRKALRQNRDERYPTAQEMLDDLLALRRSVDSAVHPSAVDAAAPGQPVSAGNESQGRVIPPGRYKLKALAAVALTLLGAVAVFLLHGRIDVDSIAVAPFASVDRDAKGQQIADGISENLINELSRFSGVRVKSREAVAPYSESDPQTMGRKLGVTAVLTGRVLRTGHNVSVVVELIDPRDNTQIWGEIYHLTNSDSIELEDEVSRLIIEEIQVRLSIGLRAGRRDPSGLLETGP